MRDTERDTRAEPMPTALSRIPESRIVDVDVRDDLRSGEEPFRKIMAARARVPEGGALRLRAIFEPVPLYRVMAGQGFAHWTERFADDDWRVWFYREQASGAESMVEAGAPAGTGSDPAEPGESVRDESAGDGGGEEAARTGSGRAGAERDAVDDPSRATAGTATGAEAVDDDGDDVVILDVRGLEPPEPMTRTLAALEALPEGKTLLQINVRVPRFLLPRLEERGWSWEIREQEDGPVRVFIRRADG